jgi:hypothetical protein
VKYIYLKKKCIVDCEETPNKFSQKTRNIKLVIRACNG